MTWRSMSGRAERPKAAWSRFRPAVAELETALHTVENNAPINEREGNHRQAELERRNAKDFRAAIAGLKS